MAIRIKRTLMIVTAITLLTASVHANTACLTDLGPFENHQGWAIFPFKNDCSDDATISLCVKSWPPGSSEPAYNFYGGRVPANDRLDVTDGMWRHFDSYRWQENGPQICPFD